LTPIDNQHHLLPSVEEVKELLDQKLIELQKSGTYLNTITFAGNGEPTLHPHFPQIIEEAIESRNRIFPEAKIAVLSNATLIGSTKIFDALSKADLNILKLDSAVEKTLKLINCPGGNYNLSSVIDNLKQFKGTMIIQTLFLKGFCNGKSVDNTTEEEVTAWSSVIETIQPETVMIYSLARDTAVHGLEKVNENELNNIAARIEKLGIRTQVTP
jgi:wyosine [tRNA(Phe)-imidazoG37] synthetase (radical SAM superfamily)